ncbi:hypothetical protein PX554_25490 [Sphingomonas sp. H39-1-10]|nr:MULTISPECIES: hypothetical protein [Sphingomonadaceae]MDF0491475.1 hypothetical protein [Sphingomonas pollutisoli]
MQRFFVTARFCTRSGRAAQWSGTISAPDIGAALKAARERVERRHRGATKLDIRAVAGPVVPSPDPAQGRTD